jgi:sugar lactone lactonase YvrE
MSKSYFLFLSILLYAACSVTSKKNTLFISTLFTPLQSFTAGAEGPAVDAAGNIYAVNLEKEGTIGKISPDGMASVFVVLANGSIGNGIRFNPKGEMFVADYTNHNVLRITSDGSVAVQAHDTSMNQPNDLAIDKEQRLYASDPSWKNGTGQLWRIDPDGRTVLLEKNMGTTNGIELSPDEKSLYVNESVQRKVWVYDLSDSGTISNKRLLVEFPDFGMDGMRTDTAGNLYITRHGKGTIAVVSPAGNLIREVPLLGKKPSNIAFGGSDGRRVYITSQDNQNIETFLNDIPGREWNMMHGGMDH